MFYKIIRDILAIIVRPLYRMEIKGRDNLPHKGSVIVVANHSSLMDPIFMGCSFNRQVRFMAKEQLFKVPILGQIIRWLGTFPVRRGAGDREALNLAQKVLADEEVLGIFPEGKRYKDGKIHPLRPGAALLAVKSGASVLPMYIANSYRLRFFRFPKIRIIIGPSFILESMGSRKESARAGAEEIYSRLLALQRLADNREI